jgi:molybdenum cofactor biosynthesis enzyme MoaA
VIANFDLWRKCFLNGCFFFSSFAINLISSIHSTPINQVRLTGGEPLLRKDLPQIISSIAERPNINSVGITTNGITLTRHLPALVEAGLTHANISLDTLNDAKFTEITRRKGLSVVLKAIENACSVLPKGNVKINCVVMKGFNDNELRDFVDISKDLPVDVRFIEWMPFNDNGWNKDRFLSYDAMMDRITSDESGEESSLKGFGPFDLQRLTDGANDTTKWWQAPDHEGRLGFITSMTQHFCGTCNRVRLTADGQLKVCLFGSAEVSLRDAMREGASDADLGLIVRAALHKKKFALGGHGNAEGIKKANNNRPMTLIGG